MSDYFQTLGKAVSRELARKLDNPATLAAVRAHADRALSSHIRRPMARDAELSAMPPRGEQPDPNGGPPVAHTSESLLAAVSQAVQNMDPEEVSKFLSQIVAIAEGDPNDGTGQDEASVSASGIRDNNRGALDRQIAQDERAARDRRIAENGGRQRRIPIEVGQANGPHPRIVMPRTEATKERGGNGLTPPAPPAASAPQREKLKAAIEELNEEKARLEAIEAALERAAADAIKTMMALREAEAKLREEESEEPERVAVNYINEGDTATVSRELESAQMAAAKAQKAHDRIMTIRQTLDREATTTVSRIRRCEYTLRELLTSVVLGCPEYTQLVERHRLLWQQLRTVKEALRVVERNCLLPANLDAESSRVEPYEIRVGYPVDLAFVEAWRDAIEGLKNAYDTELPKGDL